MKPFKWTCPHCNLKQIVNEANFEQGFQCLDVASKGVFENYPEHSLWLYRRAVVCSNDDCNRIDLSVELQVYQYRGDSTPIAKKHWRLEPESSAKPQPDFIPKTIREDYYEACKIRDLSPKASATLARRCLQGMIRDFCKISKGTLFEEIKALKALLKEGNEPRGVTPESIEAIDAVRKVGNIGAHMEKDVNVIISIDPNEAQILIDLIETLFEDWYIAREQRKNRFSDMKTLGDDKAQEKKTKAKSATPTKK